MMASTEVDDVVHWEPHLVMTPPCTSFGGHHLTGMILMLLGSISWDLVLIANVFPLLGRTGISRISSCLFNYIHRIDCTLETYIILLTSVSPINSIKIHLKNKMLSFSISIFQSGCKEFGGLEFDCSLPKELTWPGKF